MNSSWICWFLTCRPVGGKLGKRMRNLVYSYYFFGKNISNLIEKHRFTEKHFWTMGKFYRSPFQRWRRKQSPDAHDRGGADKENVRFSGWGGGRGLLRADDEKQGCGMRSGQGSSRVWEPWMQRFFQSRQQLATSRKDHFGFLRRRQSNSLSSLLR